MEIHTTLASNHRDIALHCHRNPNGRFHETIKYREQLLGIADFSGVEQEMSNLDSVMRPFQANL